MNVPLEVEALAEQVAALTDVCAALEERVDALRPLTAVVAEIRALSGKGGVGGELLHVRIEAAERRLLLIMAQLRALVAPAEMAPKYAAKLNARLSALEQWASERGFEGPALDPYVASGSALRGEPEPSEG